MRPLDIRTPAALRRYMEEEEEFRAAPHVYLRDFLTRNAQAFARHQAHLAPLVAQLEAAVARIEQYYALPDFVRHIDVWYGGAPVDQAVTLVDTIAETLYRVDTRPAVARTHKAKIHNPKKARALSLAYELRLKNPALSINALAYRIATEIDTPAGTVRRWLSK